jgi:hypothetical protein
MEKMDRLEQYIRSHREDFDEQNPDPALWEQIASRLPEPQATVRRLVMWKWMTAAAVTLALVMSGVVAGIYMGAGGNTQDPAYAEFLQAQQYYNSEYSKKKSELAQYVQDPEVDRDLKELDQMHAELSAEFSKSTNPDKSELINAMIQVYRTRIELLERVLNKVEKRKSGNPTKHEEDVIKI